jgi:hypothetical protein
MSLRGYAGPRLDPTFFEAETLKDIGRNSWIITANARTSKHIQHDQAANNFSELVSGTCQENYVTGLAHQAEFDLAGRRQDFEACVVFPLSIQQNWPIRKAAPLDTPLKRLLSYAVF